MVSINSPRKYRVIVAIGFKDRAAIGSANEIAIWFMFIALGLYSVGKIGNTNVKKYCINEAKTKDGIDMHKTTIREIM